MNKQIVISIVVIIAVVVLGYVAFGGSDISQMSDETGTDVVATDTPANNASSSVQTEETGCYVVTAAEPYDIPAQRFDETAQMLAHATDCFIQTDTTETGSVQVNAVEGEMSIYDAITTAIEGTDLEITAESDSQITVERTQ